MLFLALCVFGIFGIGIISTYLYKIPAVRETVEKLLSI